MKRANIWVIGVCVEKKDTEVDILFIEIRAENFPNQGKDINIQA